MVCAFAYLAALGVIHWLAPRLESANVEAAADPETRGNA
jgi:hypothetical protein